MRIAVAGGTGVVGRHVVGAARARGHEVVVLARSEGVDLVAGRGLEAHLAGVDAVVDTVSVSTQSGRRSAAFFEAVTGHLLATGRAAGVGHHVALSIVGVDRAPHGYYTGKVAQERLVEQAPGGWSILRATQFHEFAGQMSERMALGRLSLVPAMRCQPVAAAVVGERLVDVAERGPSGRVPDLGGPQVEQLPDMARAHAAASGSGRRVVALRVPGAMGRAFRSGVLLPGDDAELAGPTFQAWSVGSWAGEPV